MSRRRDLLLGGAAWLLGGDAGAALPAPTGTVVLTVSGKLRLPNDGERAQFDMAMLERLPQHELRPPTPWYDEPRRFTGPLLRDVMAAVGADGERLRAIALNNYRVEIPMDDLRRWDVVLARLLDGKPMSVREKGPLFVMYPFERHRELRDALYFSRCIWQLRTIDVL